MYRKYTPRRVLYVLGLVEQMGEHVSASELRQRIDPAVFDDYYKFAFVRNPWDWQVSLYHYIRSRRLHPQHREVKALPDFDAYLRWRVTQDLVLQKSFVADAQGNLLVNMLGYYESLNQDFAAICQDIGIKSTLPHKNISKHQDYRQYYSNASRRLVEKHFAEDIEYFGYKFGENR